MSENESGQPTAAGIELEYDPNRYALRIIVTFHDGESLSISQTRKEAMTLYQALGKILESREELDG